MRAVGTVSLGLAFSSIIGGAWAGEICARAQDLTALQVAAVQQHLMVAALTCNDAGLYNTFVVTYRNDLQASDATLRDFFARLSETTGRSEYDAFKTKLANDYSLNSNRNKTFCRGALAVFRAALNENKTSLASFALSQPMSVDHNYTTCGDKVDGGAMAMKATVATAEPSKAALTTVTGGATAATTADSAQKSGTADSGPYATRTYDSQAQQTTPPSSGTYRYPANNPYAVDPNARNPYARSYGYDYYYYGYPYYRSPYARYWYGGYPPQFYLRRR